MATLDQPTRPQAPSLPVGRSLVRPLLFIAVLGGIGAGGYFGFKALVGGDDSEVTDQMLTYEVARGDLLVTVREDGELESADNVEVKCGVAGGSSIISIVADGEIVEEGDLIIELDKKPLEDQIIQQQQVYERARAALIQAEQDFQVAEISIEEYEEGTFKQDLQTADANIKIAMENLRSSENALAHTERMFRKGYVSKLELETQEFAVERSQLELDSAETAKDVLVNFTKRKTIEDLTAKRDIAEAKLQSERAAFDLEESKLNQLKDQLEKCDIYAPTSGMVVYSNEQANRFSGQGGATIEEGAAVRERQGLIKLPDLTNMQVSVKVHETKVELLDRGLPAIIRVQGRELTGEVMSVANQPEATSRWEGNVKEYATLVKVDGQPDGLRPGMTAEVEILVANLPNVLLVPTSAIVQSGLNYFCWVAVDGKIEKRELIVGLTDGEFVEVKDGVAEGDVVLRNPRAVVEEARESTTEREESDASKFGDRSNVPTSSGDVNRGSAGRGGEGRGGEGRGGEGRGGEGRGGRGGEGGGGDSSSGSGASGGNAMIERMDTDGDGKISREEGSFFPDDRWSAVDTNSDGFIDAAEAEAAMSAFQRSQGQ